jgi:hypothetical protein
MLFLEDFNWTIITYRFPGLENQNRHFLKIKNVTDFSYIYFINFSLIDIIRLLKK